MWCSGRSKLNSIVTQKSDRATFNGLQRKAGCCPVFKGLVIVTGVFENSLFVKLKGIFGILNYNLFTTDNYSVVNSLIYSTFKEDNNDINPLQIFTDVSTR